VLEFSWRWGDPLNTPPCSRTGKVSLCEHCFEFVRSSMQYGAAYNPPLVEGKPRPRTLRAYLDAGRALAKRNGVRDSEVSAFALGALTAYAEMVDEEDKL
jgi:hypothetical protein